MLQLYNHFTTKELACRCGNCGLGQEHMHPETMEYFVKLRERTGIVMPVTSAVRCTVHNNKVSKIIDGPHTIYANTEPYCFSLDFLAAGESVSVFIEAGLDLGFTGFGLNQKGDWSQRYIHMDRLPRPYPAFWTY